MLSFAGVPLLLEDPDGALDAWLDRYWPLSDLRIFPSIPQGTIERNTSARRSIRRGLGLSRVNWPVCPRPKLNTLWWPTGATRWAVGLFLIEGSRVEDLAAEGSQDLVLSDGTTTLTAAMHLLPPRRISYSGGAAGSDLFLVPLVDQRWFWQFKDSGDLKLSLAPGEADTWADLFEKLGTMLGLTIEHEDIPAAYLHPDAIELGRPYQSIPALLDAAAWSVGLRIVCDLDGTVRAVNAETSGERFERYFRGVDPEDPEPEPEPDSSLAGGLSEAFERPKIPYEVQVAFPRYTGRMPHRLAGLHTATVRASDVGYEESIYGLTKRFHSTAFADHPEGDAMEETLYGDMEYVELDPPANQAELTDLATQIAQDYYDHLPPTFDVVKPGVFAWETAGWDDWVWWHIGYRLPGPVESQTASPYTCTTRVASLPPDVGIAELLHQHEMPGKGTDIYEPAATLRRFELRETLSPGDHAAAYLVRFDDSDYVTDGPACGEELSGSHSPIEFEVWDAIGHSGACGDRGWCQWMADSDRFEVVSLPSDGRVNITLTEDLGETTANEATCTIHGTWDPASEGYTGDEEGVAVDTNGKAGRDTLFDRAVSGAIGYGWRRQGAGREVIEIGNLNCGPGA